MNSWIKRAAKVKVEIQIYKPVPAVQMTNLTRYRLRIDRATVKDIGFCQRETKTAVRSYLSPSSEGKMRISNSTPP